MADPFSIASITVAALALAFECAKVVQGLTDLAKKYTLYEIKLLSMQNQCKNLNLTWDRIGTWCQLYEENDVSDTLLIHRLNEDLELGRVILSALESDMASFYSAPRSVFWQRTKMVWNENLFQDHQSRLTQHVTSTMLLLQTTYLPTPAKRKTFLIEKEQELNESHESAWTIIRSHASSMYSKQTSTQSETSLPLSYRTLEINDELFKGAVYRRNGWNITVARLIKRNPRANSLTTRRLIYRDSNDDTLEINPFSKTSQEQGEASINTKIGISKVEAPVNNDEDGKDREKEEEVSTISTKNRDASINETPNITQRKVVYSDAQDPGIWSEDLLRSCANGDMATVRKLLKGRIIFYQPKNAWCRGGSQALMAAVVHRQSRVVRILLDHCIFKQFALESRLGGSMLNDDWTSHTVRGSTQEFLYDLFELAEELNDPSMTRELTRFDYLGSLVARFGGNSTRQPNRAEDDTITDSITVYGTSSLSNLSIFDPMLSRETNKLYLHSI